MRLNYANPSFSMVIWAPATFLMILQDGFCIATIATIATRRPLQPWHSNHWSTYSPSQSTARVDVSWALESKGPTTCPDRLGQWPRWKSPDPIHPGLKRSQERNWSKHWSRVKQGEAGWSRVKQGEADMCHCVRINLRRRVKSYVRINVGINVTK